MAGCVEWAFYQSEQLSKEQSTSGISEILTPRIVFDGTKVENKLSNSYLLQTTCNFYLGDQRLSGEQG